MIGQTPRAFALGLSVLAGSSCTPGSDVPADDEPPQYTYWRDAKAIIDRKCAGCHVDGDIAPFALTTPAEVAAVAPILASSIEAGTMPPWPPGEGCNEYRNDRSLDHAERELLLTWLADGAPAGDPADEPAPSDDGESVPDFQPDVTLTIPEPYTPAGEPDDYRCFVIPWHGPEPWVTGVRMIPDQRSIVHHITALAIDPAQADLVEAMDAADPGPGYTCFGSAGIIQARWIGISGPGTQAIVYPEGTGVRLQPGSRLVLQVHYHGSSSDPVADQSAIELRLAEHVERPLVTQPVTDPGWVGLYVPMTIPAGDPDVTHATEIPLDSGLWAGHIAETGVREGEDLLLHIAGLHMHQLGVRARLTVIRARDNERECVLEIPRWDFNWQDGYRLVEPIRIHHGDRIGLQCWWDNSAENQPIIDGERLEPIDVGWGEGTRDEMCVAILVLSRA